MSTKGVRALRVSRQGDAVTQALGEVRGTADALGWALPDIWACAIDLHVVRMTFSGAETLELRKTGVDWALWFGGTFIDVFAGPGPALAEARQRGWLPKTP